MRKEPLRLFYYYGGKKRLAKEYPTPTHRTIVEPFAGSGAFGIHHLIKGNVDKLILVEKDQQVVDVWLRLLSMSVGEFLSTPVPEVGEKTYDFLWKTTQTSNCTAVSSYMTVSERQHVLILMQRKQIAAALPHVLGKVEVIGGSYETSPDVVATWFIDPPYQILDEDPKRYKHSKGEGYGHGCRASNLNYAELADWCESRRGQVIVCEQQGATWLPFEPLKLHQISTGKMKTEVCWYKDAQGYEERNGTDRRGSD